MKNRILSIFLVTVLWSSLLLNNLNASGAGVANIYDSSTGITWSLIKPSSLPPGNDMFINSINPPPQLPDPFIIPPYIEEYTIVGIYDSLFKYSDISDLKTIIIPWTVTYIEKGLFQNLPSSPDHNIVIEYEGDRENLGLGHIINSPGTIIHYSDGTDEEKKYIGWISGSAENALYWEADKSNNMTILTESESGGNIPALPALDSFLLSNSPVKQINELHLSSEIHSIPQNFIPSTISVNKLYLDKNITTKIPENALQGVTNIIFEGLDSEWDAIKPDNLNLSSDYTMYKCHVSFQAGDHGSFTTAPASVDVWKGSTISEPENNPIPDPGYSFSNWYYKDTNDNITNWDFDSDHVQHSMELIAGYTEMPRYELDLQVDNGSSSANYAGLSDGNSEALNKAYEGQEVTIITRPDDGYYAGISVQTESGQSIIVRNNKFTMPSEKVIVNVIFSATNYSVEVKTNQKGTVTADPVSGPKGTDVTLHAEPIEHYRFVGWKVTDSDGDISVNSNNQFKIRISNVSVDAEFEVLPKHSISIKNDSRYGLLSAASEAFAGDEIVLTANVNEGYELVSFSYQDENGMTQTVKDSLTFTMPDRPVTIVPSYKAKTQYTFIWLNGDGSILDTKTYYEGQTPPTTDKTPTLASSTDADYVFSGEWTSSISGNTKTFKPKFDRVEKTKYTVIWLNGDGSELDKKTYREGQSEPVTTKTPVKVEDAEFRYTFKKWDQGTVEGNTKTYRPEFNSFKKTNDTEDSDSQSSIPTENSEPGQNSSQASQEDSTPGSAYSKPNPGNSDSAQAVTYQVVFMIDSEFSSAVQTVVKGNKANKPADPSKEGYLFVGWYTDSSLTTPFTFDTIIESDTTVFAKWTPKAPETDETIEYTVVEGAAQKWTKDTASNIIIRVKRNINDNTTIKHFVALQIDGKALIKDTDYTVSEGSIIVSVKPATLQNLANGIHRVTFVFDDGKAETTLTIVENTNASGSGSSSGGSSSSTNGSSVPQTGDIFSNPVIWFGGMLLVMFVLRLFIRARETRIAEAALMQKEKY